MAAKNQISRIQHRRGLQVDLSGIILNSGEFGWAADERRIYIGNRTLENAPVDENVEILTEQSILDASNIVKTFTLAALGVIGTATTYTSFDTTLDNTLRVDYKLTQGAVMRTGTLRVISDGTSVSFDDDYIEVGGASTVILTAAMSGTTMLLQYNAGATATLAYFVDSY